MLSAKILQFGQRLIEQGAWYFAPISWIYAFVVFIRNQLYDRKLLAITHVSPVVVSVGNVLAGGTGKTPFVHLLAQKFAHRKVAILSRGYGEIPDEPMLLAKRLPNVSVHIGKNRAELAKTIDADLILLDDGFQHRKLHRDFDIVLGGGVGHYLPRGFLRDSPKRLEKADAQFSLGRELKLAVNRILDLKGNVIPSIRGWKVAVFCGISHPERFKKIVEELGAEIRGEKFFADHEKADLSQLPAGLPLICTEKDAVKLPSTDLPIYFLEMQMEVVDGIEKWEKLIEKIDKTIDNRHRL